MVTGKQKIANIIKRDREVFLTTTRAPYEFVADHGDGDFAYDITGRKLIDFSSFISVYNLGVNGNSEIRQAIKRQSRQAKSFRIHRLLLRASSQFCGIIA